MTDPNELAPWLEPAAHKATNEQQQQLQQAADRAIERYPNDPQMQQAALTGAAQYILGQLTLENLGTQRHQTQQQAAWAYAAAEAAATAAVESGDWPQRAAAKAAHIDRMSLRRGLGLR